jgi:apolipoprotein D and lipocalin family protein
MHWSNKLALPFTILGSLASMSSAMASTTELKRVPYVDLKRYMGDWNVIANIPNFIEKDCVSSVESYALREDGDIDNWFVCHKKDGSETKMTSKCSVVDPSTNADWKVRFNIDTFLGKIPAPLRFAYVVIDLDAVNYSYTVVGHPSRKLVWIMTKNKSIEEATYQGILTRLKDQGYDLSKIVKLPQ